MAQIQAKPKNLFSWGFDLYESGNFVLTMDMSWLREGGHFEGGGLQYTLSRESVWSGDFLLQANGQTLASATKPSVWMRRFIVHFDGRELSLSAASVFMRRFVVIENDTIVGEIAPNSFFSRQCTIDLPDDLSVPVQVFIFWLTILMWRRAANAAAASS